MKPAQLTVIKGGINRLRLKGGASADTLYDLINGWVTESFTVKARPGTTRDEKLSTSTHGLCYFQGTFHVFAIAVTAVPTGYTCHVIANPVDLTLDIKTIHFAQPYLGSLYVVAEFTNGSIYHYWLSSSGVWKANTIYNIGDIVTPTAPNGLVYTVQRLNAANPVWTASIPRAVNDVVEPTIYDGYYFTVTAVVGANPHSGATEPAWTASEGGVTIEDADANQTTDAVIATNPTQNAPAAVQTRYNR